MSVSEGKRQVVCPGCGERKTLAPALEEGTRISCETCAGSAFRAVHRDGQWALEPIYSASCPICDEALELATNVQPGGRVTHCRQSFRLSFEYGVWALEKDDGSLEIQR